jgi:hypothetical protein
MAEDEMEQQEKDKDNSNEAAVDKSDDMEQVGENILLHQQHARSKDVQHS